jgi:histidyl-tRNA synthetase
MEIHSIKGTVDLIGPEIKKWRYLEKLARDLFESYGYEEIRTPIIEPAILFTKSIGAATDIVKKEMFTFRDRGQRSLALRPEETASVVRAYVEHKLDKKSKLLKVYYLGPMFRSERPQAGRQRQFHQMGVEAIGSYDPCLDVEIISLMHNITAEIGLRGCSLKLNSLGCFNDRKRYLAALKTKLKTEVKNLCPDCKTRFKVNPLRILDCKNSSCRKIIVNLPGPLEYLCPTCKRDLETVEKGLNSIGVAYQLDPHLVRGLDYYTGTTFELRHSKLGAKNALCAGGRYDKLVSDFGGPETGACGFAFGIERLILAADAEGIKLKEEEKNSVYIACTGEDLKERACQLANDLRQDKIKTYLDYQDRSLKAQMRQANKFKCKFVIVVGQEELKNNKVVLKDMEAHTQKQISLNALKSGLKEQLAASLTIK